MKKEKLSNLISKGKTLNPQSAIDKNSAEDLMLLSKLVDKATDTIISNMSSSSKSTQQEIQTFDYSTLSKNKFSKGNTTPINLFNTLKEKGIIGFEVGDNDETLKATKTLLGGINKELVSDNLPGMLNTELDVGTYGENFGEGFAKFIYGNSSNITAEEFETLANEIVAPLNNNGKLSAVSKYRDLITESDVTSEISKKMNMDFLDKIKGASSFLNDKDNEILKKIYNNEMISPEEAKQVQDAKDTIEDYKKFIKDTATKYGVSEESVINKTPREIKSNLYNYNKTDKIFEFNNQKGAYSKIENIDFNTDTGEYIKRPVNNDTTPKDIFENLTKKQGYDELGDINSQNMEDVLKGLKDKIEDIENPHLKEYIDYADELGRKGISLGEDGERLLKTYNSVLNNTTLNDQNKNAILKELDSISPNINQNIINKIGKDNLKKLDYLDYSDGKFKLKNELIENLTEDDKKEFKKLLESKDIGNEDISELVNRVERNNFIKDLRTETGNKDLSFEDVSKNISKKIIDVNSSDYIKNGIKDVSLNESEYWKIKGIEKEEIDNIIKGPKDYKSIKKIFNTNIDVEADKDLILFGNLAKSEKIEKILKNNYATSQGIEGGVLTPDAETAFKNLGTTEKIDLLKESLGLSSSNEGILGKGYEVKLKKNAFKNKEEYTNFITSLEGKTADEIRKNLADKFDVIETEFGVKDKGILDKIINFRNKGITRYNEEGKTIIEQINSELSNIGKTFGLDSNFTDKDFEKLYGKEIYKGLKDGNMDEIQTVSKIKNVLGNEGSNRAIDKLKNISEKNLIKGGLIAGAIGLGVAVSSAVSNASEERRRKEMELNQLIMATNSGYRGAY